MKNKLRNMAKAIKQDDEEKYVQDIFLSMEEHARFVRSQISEKYFISEEDFKPSHFITLYDKSRKIELSYFLSENKYDTEATTNNLFMKLSPLSEWGGKEKIQEIKQIFYEAGIKLEPIGEKCEMCGEKIILFECETCGREICPECMVLKDLEDEHNICIDCIIETET